MRLIYKPEYQYKKAGVVVSSIVPSEAVQGAIFDFDEEGRQKNDRISEVIDKLGGQSQLLRIAAQRPGHYADGIRSEYLSKLYTTSLDEIIEVH
jgi:DNA polymerase V